MMGIKLLKISSLSTIKKLKHKNLIKNYNTNGDIKSILFKLLKKG